MVWPPTNTSTRCGYTCSVLSTKAVSTTDYRMPLVEQRSIGLLEGFFPCFGEGIHRKLRLWDEGDRPRIDSKRAKIT